MPAWMAAPWMAQLSPVAVQPAAAEAVAKGSAEGEGGRGAVVTMAAAQTLGLPTASTPWRTGGVAAPP